MSARRGVYRNWIYKVFDLALSGALVIFCLGFFLFILSVCYDAFEKGYFSSDGYHYFSALRNAAQYGSLWEGPTFEYLLGNHSYISLYIFTPLVSMFPHPLALGFLPAVCQFSTAFLLFLCCREMIDKKSTSIPCLLALAYLFAPLVMEGYFAQWFLFQPDYFLPPLLALMMLAALREWTFTFFAAGVLIVLTKEEYIPLFPIFTFFILHTKRVICGRWFPEHADRAAARKFLSLLVICYLLSSAISLAVLIVFREINQVDHAVRMKFFFESLFFAQAWESALLATWHHIYPLLPLLLLALAVLHDKAIYVPLFYILAFSTGRILLNQVVYGYPQGNSWGNVLVPVSLYLSAATLIGILLRGRIQKAFVLLIGLALGGCLVHSLAIALEPTPTNWLTKINFDGLPAKVNPHELEHIRKHLEPAKGRGYIVVDEFLMGPFMERSHVGGSFLANQTQENKAKLLKNADYIILFTSFGLAAELEKDSDNFTKITQTPMLSCFQPLKAREKKLNSQAL